MWQAAVLSAYGHTHNQGCHGFSPTTGQCELMMTGGGGGCCHSDLPNNYVGFTAVHLTADGGYTIDHKSEDVRTKETGMCAWGETAQKSAEPSTGGKAKVKADKKAERKKAKREGKP